MLIFIIFLLLLSPVSAEKKSGTVTVAAGISAPISPHAITSNYGIGANIGFGLGYELSPFLELEPRVYFSSFPHEDDESFKAFELGADWRMFTQEHGPEQLAPYFILGLGLSYLSYSNGQDLWGDQFDQGSKTGTETNFSLNLGLGLDHPIRPGYGFFIDIRYAINFGDYDQISYIPIRFGFKFSSKTITSRP